MKGESFVYLIEMMDGSLAKIGLARNPWARFHSLKTGNASPMKMTWYLRGGRDVERALHESLAAYKQVREWYREPGLLALVFDNLHDVLDDRAIDATDDTGDFDAAFERQVLTPADAVTVVTSTLAYWESDERLADDEELAGLTKDTAHG